MEGVLQILNQPGNAPIALKMGMAAPPAPASKQQDDSVVRSAMLAGMAADPTSDNSPGLHADLGALAKAVNEEDAFEAYVESACELATASSGSSAAEAPTDLTLLPTLAPTTPGSSAAAAVAVAALESGSLPAELLASLFAQEFGSVPVGQLFSDSDLSLNHRALVEFPGTLQVTSASSGPGAKLEGLTKAGSPHWYSLAHRDTKASFDLKPKACLGGVRVTMAGAHPPSRVALSLPIGPGGAMMQVGPTLVVPEGASFVVLPALGMETGSFTLSFPTVSSGEPGVVSVGRVSALVAPKTPTEAEAASTSPVIFAPPPASPLRLLERCLDAAATDASLLPAVMAAAAATADSASLLAAAALVLKQPQAEVEQTMGALAGHVASKPMLAAAAARQSALCEGAAAESDVLHWRLGSCEWMAKAAHGGDSYVQQQLVFSDGDSAFVMKERYGSQCWVATKQLLEGDSIHEIDLEVTLAPTTDNDNGCCTVLQQQVALQEDVSHSDFEKVDTPLRWQGAGKVFDLYGGNPQNYQSKPTRSVKWPEEGATITLCIDTLHGTMHARVGSTKSLVLSGLVRGPARLAFRPAGMGMRIKRVASRRVVAPPPLPSGLSKTVAELLSAPAAPTDSPGHHALLYAIARLAQEYAPQATVSMSGFKPPSSTKALPALGVTSAAKSLPLREPFAVAASPLLFKAALHLLLVLLPRITEGDEHALKSTLSVLVIVRASLCRAAAARVSGASIGVLLPDGRLTPVAEELMFLVQAGLLGLKQDVVVSPEVQAVAAAAAAGTIPALLTSAAVGLLIDGLDFLFATTGQQVQLFTAVLQADAGEAGTNLATALLNRLCRGATVASLLPSQLRALPSQALTACGPTEDAKAALEPEASKAALAFGLVQQLLVRHNATAKQCLQAKDAAPLCTPLFTTSMKLVCTILHAVFTGVITDVEAAARERAASSSLAAGGVTDSVLVGPHWDATSSLARAPRVQLASKVALLVLDAVRDVLGEVCLAARGSAEEGVVAHDVLRVSVVGDLLPLLLALCAHRALRHLPIFSTQVLPALHHVLLALHTADAALAAAGAFGPRQLGASPPQLSGIMQGTAWASLLGREAALTGSSASELSLTVGPDAALLSCGGLAQAALASGVLSVPSSARSKLDAVHAAEAKVPVLFRGTLGTVGAQPLSVWVWLLAEHAAAVVGIAGVQSPGSSSKGSGGSDGSDDGSVASGSDSDGSEDGGSAASPAEEAEQAGGAAAGEPLESKEEEGAGAGVVESKDDEPSEEHTEEAAAAPKAEVHGTLIGFGTSEAGDFFIMLPPCSAEDAGKPRSAMVIMADRVQVQQSTEYKSAVSLSTLRAAGQATRETLVTSGARVAVPALALTHPMSALNTADARQCLPGQFPSAGKRATAMLPENCFVSLDTPLHTHPTLADSAVTAGALSSVGAPSLALQLVPLSVLAPDIAPDDPGEGYRPPSVALGTPPSAEDKATAQREALEGVVQGRVVSMLRALRSMQHGKTATDHLATALRGHLSGLLGINWLQRTQRQCSVAMSRLAAGLLRGSLVSYEEVEMAPLLGSKLLAGGVACPASTGQAGSPFADLDFHAAVQHIRSKPAGAFMAAPAPAAQWVDSFLPPQDEPVQVSDPLVIPGDVDGCLSTLYSETVQSESLTGSAEVLFAWLCKQRLPKSVAQKRKLAKQAKFPQVELLVWLSIVKLSGASAVASVAACVRALKEADEAAAAAVVSDCLLDAWKDVRSLRTYLVTQQAAMSDEEAPKDASSNTGGAAASGDAPSTSDLAADQEAPAETTGIPTESTPSRQRSSSIGSTESEPAAERQESEASTLSDASSASGSTDESDESSDEDESDSESDAAAPVLQPSTSSTPWSWGGQRRVLEPQRSTCFAELLRQMQERVRLLLTLQPGEQEGAPGGTGLATAGSGVEGTSEFSTLEERFSDAGVKSRTALLPSSESEGGAIPPPPPPSSGLDGMLTMLARQRSWHRPVGDEGEQADEGAPESDIPLPPMPPSQGTAVSTLTPGKAKAATMRTLGFAKLAVRADVLHRLLWWRRVRADARAFGLASLHSGLSELPQADMQGGADQSLLVLLRCDLLRHARAGLRSVTEALEAATAKATEQALAKDQGKQSGDEGEEDKPSSLAPRDPDLLLWSSLEEGPFCTWPLLHHHTHGVLAAPQASMVKLQGEAVGLLKSVMALLRQSFGGEGHESLSEPVTALQNMCIAYVAQGWNESDWPVLQSTGLLQLLHMGCGARVAPPPGKSGWAPWRFEDVKRFALLGQLPKASIIRHMQCAPDGFLASAGQRITTTAEWCDKAGLSGDAEVVARNLTLQEVLLKYAVFGKVHGIPGINGADSLLGSTQYVAALRKASESMSSLHAEWAAHHGKRTQDNYSHELPADSNLPFKFEVLPITESVDVSSLFDGPVEFHGGSENWELEVHPGVPKVGGGQLWGNSDCTVKSVPAALKAAGSRMAHALFKEDWVNGNDNSVTFHVTKPVRIWVAVRCYTYEVPECTDKLMLALGFDRVKSMDYMCEMYGDDRVYQMYARKWLEIPQEGSPLKVKVSLRNPLQGHEKRAGKNSIQTGTFFLEAIDPAKVQFLKGLGELFAPEQAGALRRLWECSGQSDTPALTEAMHTAFSEALAPEKVQDACSGSGRAGAVARVNALNTAMSKCLTAALPTASSASLPTAPPGTDDTVAGEVSNGISSITGGASETFDPTPVPETELKLASPASLVASVLTKLAFGAQPLDSKGLKRTASPEADSTRSVQSSVLQLSRVNSTAGEPAGMEGAAGTDHEPLVCLQRESLATLGKGIDAYVAELRADRCGEHVAAEAALNGHFGELLSLAGSATVREALVTAAWLERMVIAFAFGSLRLRRAVLLLLGSCAHELRPSFVGAALKSAWPAAADIDMWSAVYAGDHVAAGGSAVGGDTSTISSVALGWLLHMVAAPVAMSWGAHLPLAWTGVQHPDAPVASTPECDQALASLALQLLRRLALDVHGPWAKHLVGLVPAAINEAAAWLQDGADVQADKHALARILACMRFLAAADGGLFVGARVALPGTGAGDTKTGTVLSLSHTVQGADGDLLRTFFMPGMLPSGATPATGSTSSSSECTVLVAEGITLTSTMRTASYSPTDLTPALHPPASAELVRLDAPVLHSLISLAQGAGASSLPGLFLAMHALGTVQHLLEKQALAKPLIEAIMHGSAPGSLPPFVSALYEGALKPLSKSAAAYIDAPDATLLSVLDQGIVLSGGMGGVSPACSPTSSPTTPAAATADTPGSTSDSTLREVASSCTCDVVSARTALMLSSGKVDDAKALLKSDSGAALQGLPPQAVWSAEAPVDVVQQLCAEITDWDAGAFIAHIPAALTKQSGRVAVHSDGAEGAAIVLSVSCASACAASSIAVPLATLPALPADASSPVHVATRDGCTLALLTSEAGEMGEVCVPAKSGKVSVSWAAAGASLLLSAGAVSLDLGLTAFAALPASALKPCPARVAVDTAAATPAFARAAVAAAEALRRPIEGDKLLLPQQGLSSAALALQTATTGSSLHTSERALAGLPAWVFQDLPGEKGLQLASETKLPGSADEHLSAVSSLAALGMLDPLLPQALPADEKGARSRGPRAVSCSALMPAASSASLAKADVVEVPLDPTGTGGEEAMGVVGVSFLLKKGSVDTWQDVRMSLGLAQGGKDPKTLPGRCPASWALAFNDQCLYHASSANWVSGFSAPAGEDEEVEAKVLHMPDGSLRWWWKGGEVGSDNKFTGVEGPLFPVMWLSGGENVELHVTEVVMASAWQKKVAADPGAKLTNKQVWEELKIVGDDIPFRFADKNRTWQPSEQDARRARDQPEDYTAEGEAAFETVGSTPGLGLKRNSKYGSEAKGGLQCAMLKAEVKSLSWDGMAPEKVLGHPFLHRFLPMLHDQTLSSWQIVANMVQGGADGGSVLACMLAHAQLRAEQRLGAAQARLDAVATDRKAATALDQAGFGGDAPSGEGAQASIFASVVVSDAELQGSFKRPLEKTGGSAVAEKEEEVVSVSLVLPAGEAPATSTSYNVAGVACPATGVLAVPFELPDAAAVAHPEHAAVASKTCTSDGKLKAESKIASLAKAAAATYGDGSSDVVDLVTRRDFKVVRTLTMPLGRQWSHLEGVLGLSDEGLLGPDVQGDLKCTFHTPLTPPVRLGYVVRVVIKGDGVTLASLPALDCVGASWPLSLSVYSVDQLTVQVEVSPALGKGRRLATDRDDDDEGESEDDIAKRTANFPDLIPSRLVLLLHSLNVAGPGAADLRAGVPLALVPKSLATHIAGDKPAWACVGKGISAMGSGLPQLLSGISADPVTLPDGLLAKEVSTALSQAIPMRVHDTERGLALVQLVPATSAYTIDAVLGLAQGDRDGTRTVLEDAMTVLCVRAARACLLGALNASSALGDCEAATALLMVLCTSQDFSRLVRIMAVRDPALGACQLPSVGDKPPQASTEARAGLQELSTALHQAVTVEAAQSSAKHSSIADKLLVEALWHLHASTEQRAKSGVALRAPGVALSGRKGVGSDLSVMHASSMVVSFSNSAQSLPSGARLALLSAPPPSGLSDDWCVPVEDTGDDTQAKSDESEQPKVPTVFAVWDSEGRLLNAAQHKGVAVGYGWTPQPTPTGAGPKGVKSTPASRADAAGAAAGAADAEGTSTTAPEEEKDDESGSKDKEPTPLTVDLRWQSVLIPASSAHVYVDLSAVQWPGAAASGAEHKEEDGAAEQSSACEQKDGGDALAPAGVSVGLSAAPVHVGWKSEAEADTPSPVWGAWLLAFLLNRVLSSLPVQGQALEGLHNNGTVLALLRHARHPGVPGRLQAALTQLASQILSTGHLFHPQHPPCTDHLAYAPAHAAAAMATCVQVQLGSAKLPNGSDVLRDVGAVGVATSQTMALLKSLQQQQSGVLRLAGGHVAHTSLPTTLQRGLQVPAGLRALMDLLAAAKALEQGGTDAVHSSAGFVDKVAALGGVSRDAVDVVQTLHSAEAVEEAAVSSAALPESAPAWATVARRLGEGRRVDGVALRLAGARVAFLPPAVAQSSEKAQEEALASFKAQYAAAHGKSSGSKKATPSTDDASDADSGSDSDEEVANGLPEMADYRHGVQLVRPQNTEGRPADGEVSAAQVLVFVLQQLSSSQLTTLSLVLGVGEDAAPPLSTVPGGSSELDCTLSGRVDESAGAALLASFWAQLSFAAQGIVGCNFSDSIAVQDVFATLTEDEHGDRAAAIFTNLLAHQLVLGQGRAVVDLWDVVWGFADVLLSQAGQGAFASRAIEVVDGALADIVCAEQGCDSGSLMELEVKDLKDPRPDDSIDHVQKWVLNLLTPPVLSLLASLHLPRCPKPWDTEWTSSDAARTAAEEGGSPTAEDGAAAEGEAADVKASAAPACVPKPLRVQVKNEGSVPSEVALSYIGHSRALAAAFAKWQEKADEGAVWTPKVQKLDGTAEGIAGEVAIVSADRPGAFQLPEVAAGAGGAGGDPSAFLLAHALSLASCQTVEDVAGLSAVEEALLETGKSLARAASLAGKQGQTVYSGKALKDVGVVEASDTATAVYAGRVLESTGMLPPLFGKVVLVTRSAATTVEALRDVLKGVVAQRPAAVVLEEGGVVSPPASDGGSSLAALIGTSEGMAALGTKVSCLVPYHREQPGADAKAGSEHAADEEVRDEGVPPTVVTNTPLLLAGPSAARKLTAAAEAAVAAAGRSAGLIAEEAAQATTEEASGEAAPSKGGAFALLAGGAATMVARAAKRAREKRAAKALQAAAGDKSGLMGGLALWRSGRQLATTGKGIKDPRVPQPMSHPSAFASRTILPTVAAARSGGVQIADIMSTAQAMAETLTLGVDASDAFVASTWLPVAGLSRHVESNHPYRAGERLCGAISIPGATSLAVTLDPNTSLGAGAVLYLSASASCGIEAHGVSSAKGDDKPRVLAVTGVSPRDAHRVPALAPTTEAKASDKAAALKAAAEEGVYLSSLSEGETIIIQGSSVAYSLQVPAGADVSPGLWGVGFTVSPGAIEGSVAKHETCCHQLASMIPLRCLDALLWGGLHSMASTAKAAGLTASSASAWSAEEDADLVELANVLAKRVSALGTSQESLRDEWRGLAKKKRNKVPQPASRVYGMAASAAVKVTATSLPPCAVHIPPNLALKFRRLAGIPLQRLRARLAALQVFNAVLRKAVAAVPLSSDVPTSIAGKLAAASRFTFPHVKQDVLEGQLQTLQMLERKLLRVNENVKPDAYSKTKVILPVGFDSDQGCALPAPIPVWKCPDGRYTTSEFNMPLGKLSNFTATRSEEEGLTSVAESENIFVQLFESWESVSPVAFRSGGSSNRNLLFGEGSAAVGNIKFEGEQGIDQGGVFREGMTRATEELFSSKFELLLPTPNAARGEGGELAVFLPNPTATSPRALSMLRFIGQWMAMSLRSGAAVPFCFPPLVYKAILGDEPDEHDLLLISSTAHDFAISVRDCDAEFDARGKPREPITCEADFAQAFTTSQGPLTFSMTEPDGSVVELVPGGAAKQVTFANRAEFAQALLHHHLHKYDTGLQALVQGFRSVIPERILQLVTAPELEVLVAGVSTVDVELLKRNTVYSGYTSQDAIIKWFWEVFEDMSDEERTLYIRFAWGRGRIPPSDAAWVGVDKHGIDKARGKVDALPEAHTCFFSIDLPEYPSKEVLRSKLLTAVTLGGGILNG